MMAQLLKSFDSEKTKIPSTNTELQSKVLSSVQEVKKLMMQRGHIARILVRKSGKFSAFSGLYGTVKILFQTHATLPSRPLTQMKLDKRRRTDLQDILLSLL